MSDKMFISRWHTLVQNQLFSIQKIMYSLSGGVRQPLMCLSQDVIKHLDESTALCCQISLKQSKPHAGEFTATVSSEESRRQIPSLQKLHAKPLQTKESYDWRQSVLLFVGVCHERIITRSSASHLGKWLLNLKLDSINCGIWIYCIMQALYWQHAPVCLHLVRWLRMRIIINQAI